MTAQRPRNFIPDPWHTNPCSNLTVNTKNKIWFTDFFLSFSFRSSKEVLKNSKYFDVKLLWSWVDNVEHLYGVLAHPVLMF